MKYRTFQEARKALLNGETSCETLVSSFLEQIRHRNAELNIFLSTREELAVEDARRLDVNGARERPLAGLVMGIKDVLCLKDEPASCGSRMLENFRSLYDATAISRLREAGAVILGKLNCDEFAMGSSNENSYFGPVRNPANPEFVPGGSSGGSAAAVAAEMCHVSLGTDTGGSIRQPASFCGVVGLKPTYGRVSRYGLVAFASSFDTIGPLGHSVEDVADVLQVMAGRDPADSTSAPADVPDYRSAMTGSVEGLRIGLPREYFAEGLDPQIRTIIEAQAERLVSAGAEVLDVSLPHTEYGIAAYYILSTAEASSNLARYDGVRYGHRADLKEVRRQLAAESEALETALEEAGRSGNAERLAEIRGRIEAQDSVLRRIYSQTRTEGFGSEVKRRIMLGTYVLSAGYYDAYYARAQRVRTLIRRDFEDAFEKVDVLLTPAAPTPAFRLGSKTDDPLAMYLSDVYTVTASLAGVPGLVVPTAKYPDASGLPVGAQILGRHFDEATLLRVGQVAMGPGG